MPSFRYEAVDPAGRPRRGIVDAATARAARDLLRTDGLYPTAIETSAGAITTLTEATRLSPMLLALTTRQMATLVASGMPLDQALPFLTRALIASSDFLRATGWYWLGAFALFAIGVTLLLRREYWRDRWHTLLLRLPVAGRVLSGLDTARFASTLSILTGSGAPLLRALDTAAGVVWARPMRRAADAVAAHVREGVSLARALASQRVFPPLLVHLVANGEQSGQLPAMLDRAAREQEQDVERRLTWLAALVQPLLIVFMGAIVLVLVLAVMLPIVSMNQLIR